MLFRPRDLHWAETRDPGPTYGRVLWSLPAPRTSARTSRPVPRPTSGPAQVSPAPRRAPGYPRAVGPGRVLPPRTWQSRSGAGASMVPRGWQGRYPGFRSLRSLPCGGGGRTPRGGAAALPRSLIGQQRRPRPGALRGGPRLQLPAWAGGGTLQWEPWGAHRPPPPGTEPGPRARARPGIRSPSHFSPTASRGLLPAGDPVGNATAESLGRLGSPRAAVPFKLVRVPSSALFTHMTRGHLWN